jgi:hypothetical protein
MHMQEIRNFTVRVDEAKYHLAVLVGSAKCLRYEIQQVRERVFSQSGQTNGKQAPQPVLIVCYRKGYIGELCLCRAHLLSQRCGRPFHGHQSSFSRGCVRDGESATVHVEIGENRRPQS